MTIKNIVMAGGAYNGLYIIGALKYLIENSFFDINNIETIYGTSVGGFIGVLLCLKIEWSIILNYILERPWDRDLTFTADMMFNMIPKKGILDSSYMKIHNFLFPIFCFQFSIQFLKVAYIDFTT